MRRTLTISAMLALTTCAMGRWTGPDATKDVATFSKQIENAFVQNDFEFLEAALADDCVIITTGGYSMGKDEQLEDMKRGFVMIDAVNDSEVKTRVYNDAAVVSGRRWMKVRYKGVEISGPARFTEVFVRRGAKWQCVSSQLTGSGIQR